jgi:hypothetical protein
MTDPKNPTTDLIRKLTASTSRALTNLHEFNKSLADFDALLRELAGKVEHVEHLEARAVAATLQFHDVTRRYQETEAELQQTKANLAHWQAEVSVPATKLHEIRTMLRDL